MKCFKCRSEMTEDHAIILSPPDIYGEDVSIIASTYRICGTCWLCLCKWLSGGTRNEPLLPLPNPSLPLPLEPPPPHTLVPTPIAEHRCAPVARACEEPLLKLKETLGDETKEIMEFWNGFFGLPRIHIIGKKVHRIKKLLQDEFFVENWKDAIRKLAKSEFCRGKNSRAWKADFNWFLNLENIEKLINGKYDDSAKPEETQPDYGRTEI